MLFRLRKPRPPLSHFVEHVWFYRDLQVGHRREKLLPDAAMEFIIDLTDSPKKLFNGTTTQFRTYRNAWISGMHRRFLVIGAENKSSMIGAHFHAGGAAPFFRFPLSELAGDVVELDLIFKREILALRDRILETDVSTGSSTPSSPISSPRPKGSSPTVRSRPRWHTCARIR
jgi:hypothetical protein